MVYKTLHIYNRPHWISGAAHPWAYGGGRGALDAPCDPRCRHLPIYPHQMELVCNKAFDHEFE